MRQKSKAGLKSILILGGLVLGNSLWARTTLMDIPPVPRDEQPAARLDGGPARINGGPAAEIFFSTMSTHVPDPGIHFPREPFSDGDGR